MIFQKSSRKSKNINFQHQSKPIEIVQEYTYLGIKLTSNGSFKLAEKNSLKKQCVQFLKLESMLTHLNYQNI